MFRALYKSPMAKAALRTTQASALSYDQPSQLEQHQPFSLSTIIADNPQYFHLYRKIYKSQQKVHKSLSQQYKKQQINNIKETIAVKLQQEERQKQFIKKFGKTISFNVPKLIKKHNTFFGFTHQQQNNDKLNRFLIDHRNAIQLQQRARLVQYHLKDQQKTKSNISYLKKVQLTDKHRRTAPNICDRSQKLFKKKNQQNYHLLKKISFLKNDKELNTSIQKAKNNATYLRMSNFAQIKYIINEDNKNLMISCEIPKDLQKQKVYNMKMKLFISIAAISQPLRMYYEYIPENEFHKIVELLLPDSPSQRDSCQITPQYIEIIIQNIIKYKQNKVIQFEDFNEIIVTIKEQKNYDLIAKIHQFLQNNNTESNKFRKLLTNNIDKFIQQHHPAILQMVKQEKVEVIARKIYEVNRNKIIGREYLPLRDIVQFMKKLNLVPKVVLMSKLMYTCFWYQTRREGFTKEEFVKLQIAIGLCLNCSINGLQNYLQMIKVLQLFFD